MFSAMGSWLGGTKKRGPVSPIWCFSTITWGNQSVLKMRLMARVSDWVRATKSRLLS